jgi:hypothetical protein
MVVVERYAMLIMAAAWALSMIMATGVAVMSSERERRTDARKVLACLLRFRLPARRER